VFVLQELLAMNAFALTGNLRPVAKFTTELEAAHDA
jgi:hypothetical protein